VDLVALLQINGCGTKAVSVFGEAGEANQVGRKLQSALAIFAIALRERISFAASIDPLDRGYFLHKEPWRFTGAKR
jgi:hypothetical protein